MVSLRISKLVQSSKNMKNTLDLGYSSYQYILGNLGSNWVPVFSMAV